MTHKTWIRLFQHNFRDDLEREMNRFISEYEVEEIKVWTDHFEWYASVRYWATMQPTYSKPPEE